MTHVDMLRAAREIVAPVGATKAIATYDQGAYRAAFLIDNRRHSAPVGPAFAKPREVIAFVNVLNGDDPTPRPASRPDLARRPLGDAESRDGAAVPIEAPDRSPVPPGSGSNALVADPAAGHETAAGVPTSPRPAAPA